MSKLLGVASMVASLCAVAFLITSDVARAEPKPEAPAPAAQAPSTAKAKPAPKAKRKRIDLGRFEGY